MLVGESGAPELRPPPSCYANLALLPGRAISARKALCIRARLHRLRNPCTKGTASACAYSSYSDEGLAPGVCGTAEAVPFVQGVCPQPVQSCRKEPLGAGLGKPMDCGLVRLPRRFSLAIPSPDLYPARGDKRGNGFLNRLQAGESRVISEALTALLDGNARTAHDVPPRHIGFAFR